MARVERDVRPVRLRVEAVVLVPAVVQGSLVLVAAGRKRERLLPDVVVRVVGEVCGRAVRLPVARAAELGLQRAGERHRGRVRRVRRRRGGEEHERHSRQREQYDTRLAHLRREAYDRSERRGSATSAASRRPRRPTTRARRTWRARRSRTAAAAASRRPAVPRSRRRRARRSAPARRRRSRSCRRPGPRRAGRRAYASGETWPTMKPRVAPEKRPSVTRVTASPRPSPTMAAVTCEHLPHAGAARRPLVADDDHVAGADLLRCDGGEAVLLGVEDPGRAAVERARDAGELHDAALGSEVPAEHAQPAALLDRVSMGTDHLLTGRLDAPRRRSPRGSARRPSCLGVDEPALRATRGRRGRRRRRRARSVGEEPPPGLMSVITGVLRRHLVEVPIVNSIPSSRAIANRCRTAFVEPPVATTAGDRVLERLAGDDVATGRMRRARAPSRVGLPCARRPPCRVERRDAVEAGRRDAEELDRHRHRVGGELAAAGPCARAARPTRARADPRRSSCPAALAPIALVDVLDRHFPPAEVPGAIVPE